MSLPATNNDADVKTREAGFVDAAGRPADDPLVGTVTTSRAGTYNASVSVSLAKSSIPVGKAMPVSITGLAKDIEGVSGNLGLRYHFTPGQVAVALRTAPANMSQAYNWTGFYVGGWGGQGVEDWEVPSFGTVVEPRFGATSSAARLVTTTRWDCGWRQHRRRHRRLECEGAELCPNGFYFTCEAEVDRLALANRAARVRMGTRLVICEGRFGGRRSFPTTPSQPQTAYPVPGAQSSPSWEPLVNSATMISLAGPSVAVWSSLLLRLGQPRRSTCTTSWLDHVRHSSRSRRCDNHGQFRLASANHHLGN